MAGPKDIQRLPRGLVDLFGLKSTGDAPHVLSDTVAPTSDFKDEYISDRVSLVTATVVPAGTGYTNYVGSGPPFDEIWYLYHLSLATGPNGFVNAVSTFEAWLELVPSGASFGLFVPGTGTGALAAAARLYPAGGVGIMFERPVLLRAGDTFSMNVATFTGTGANSYPVLRLRVGKVKV